MGAAEHGEPHVARLSGRYLQFCRVARVRVCTAQTGICQTIAFFNRQALILLVSMDSYCTAAMNRPA